MKIESEQDVYIALAAFRYSIGRSSYSANLCIDWLKKHWDQLDNSSIIVRDAIAALMDGEAGSEFDTLLWKDFAEWGFNQMTKDEQQVCKENLDYKIKKWPLKNY